MNQEKKPSYFRFAAMIATSTVVMFGLMYINTYEFSHVRWSETRLYMTFIMGAAMAVIMLSFMQGMYSDTKVNTAIYLGSLVVFLTALFLLRSQALVQDSSYMRAMIPHHSIAILTSERAEIRDVRVRELADEIIESQRREIEEMNWLLDDIRENGIASTQAEAEERPVPNFQAEP
jgi:archaellum component FlaF (FlaF/FlaG flagellin family)